MTIVTYKRLRYFLITLRLQMLIMSLKTIKHMMWWMKLWCTYTMVKPENILIGCILSFK
jgi:hypothetical protein